MGGIGIGMAGDWRGSLFDRRISRNPSSERIVPGWILSEVTNLGCGSFGSIYNRSF